MPEETIWSGCSSHVKNFRPYLLCLLFTAIFEAVGIYFIFHYKVTMALMAVTDFPMFIGFWKWLALRARIYRITTERLLITEGVLNKTTDSLELYRVRDIRVVQPLWQRMFGLETIELDTSDDSSPLVVIDFISADLHLADKLREQVEACRVAKRVRDLDVDLPPQ